MQLLCICTNAFRAAPAQLGDASPGTGPAPSPPASFRADVGSVPNAQALGTGRKSSRSSASAPAAAIKVLREQRRATCSPAQHQEGKAGEAAAPLPVVFVLQRWGRLRDPRVSITPAAAAVHPGHFPSPAAPRRSVPLFATQEFHSPALFPTPHNFKTRQRAASGTRKKRAPWCNCLSILLGNGSPGQLIKHTAPSSTSERGQASLQPAPAGDLGPRGAGTKRQGLAASVPGCCSCPPARGQQRRCKKLLLRGAEPHSPAKGLGALRRAREPPAARGGGPGF